MKIGFLGLENLGSAVARRAVHPADLDTRCNIVFLSLRDSDVVSSVIEGPDGLLQGDHEGKIIADLTTNHFESVARFHRILGDQGVGRYFGRSCGSIYPGGKGEGVADSGSWNR